MPVREIREIVIAVPRAEETDRPAAPAVLQIVHLEDRPFHVRHIESRLSSGDFELQMDPLIGGQLGTRRETPSVVELPPRNAVEYGRVLNRVGIEPGPVGPQVDALVVPVGQHAEDQSRIGASAGNGEIDLDHSILEFYILQKRVSMKAGSSQVFLNLRILEDPAIRPEIDRFIGGGMMGRDKENIERDKYGKP